MKFLFVVMGYVESEKPGISGGDMRWLKFAQWLISQGHSVSVLSTNTCEKFIREYDSKIGFISAGNLGHLSVGTGLRRVIRSFIVVRELRGRYDVVYSVTSLLFDVLPGFLLKKRGRTKWAVVCHWVAPFGGRQTSLVRSGFFWLGDRVGLFFSTFASVILCVSTSTMKKVEKFPYIRRKILRDVGCGVDLERAGKKADIVYEGIHIKRIARTKGSFDLPAIWKNVVEKIPEAKLLMCGDGAPGEVEDLMKTIDELGMNDKVIYYGPVFDDDKKYELISSSKVFLLPSYEENWAIVIGEALATGLEVVCYDLADIRPVWGEALHWVPVGDIEEFADRVCKILNGEEPRRCGRNAPRLMSWDDMSADEFHYIEQS